MEMEYDVNRFVDLCVGTNGSHYDVARVVHHCLRHQFRYKGNGAWEYKKNDAWVADANNYELRMHVRTNVCHAVTERALFWQNQSMVVESIDVFDCQMRCQKLLTIALKLAKDQYLRDVLKEAREFFENEGA